MAQAFSEQDFYQLAKQDYNSIPAWDPVRRDHFWIVIAAYRFSGNPNVATLLDHTTVVQANGPGCYYCEMVWTPNRTGTRCPGNLQ